jgi:hypothetical protein
MPIVLLAELGKTPASTSYSETTLVDGIYEPLANATLVHPLQITRLTPA